MLEAPSAAGREGVGRGRPKLLLSTVLPIQSSGSEDSESLSTVHRSTTVSNHLSELQQTASVLLMSPRLVSNISFSMEECVRHVEGLNCALLGVTCTRIQASSLSTQKSPVTFVACRQDRKVLCWKRGWMSILLTPGSNFLSWKRFNMEDLLSVDPAAQAMAYTMYSRDCKRRSSTGRSGSPASAGFAGTMGIAG